MLNVDDSGSWNYSIFGNLRAWKHHADITAKISPSMLTHVEMRGVGRVRVNFQVTCSRSSASLVGVKSLRSSHKLLHGLGEGVRNVIGIQISVWTRGNHGVGSSFAKYS